MTVGESLSEARRRAGLSVDELSEQTRIRAAVIRSIEQDDYAACGGSLYVRGYVRAIAGAIGIDAQPLILEYDLSHAHGSAVADSPPAARDPGVTAFDLPAVATAEASPGTSGSPAEFADPEVTRFDLPPVTEDPAATRFDIPPVREPFGEDLMAAGYEVAPEAIIARGAVPGPRRPSRGGRMLAGLAGVLLVAAIGAVGVELASGTGTGQDTAALATRTAKPGGVAAGPSASGRNTAQGRSVTPSTAARSPAASPGSGPVPVTTVPIAAAEAFGPGGLADGDNPQTAKWAIGGGSSQSWTTQWYATADFGLLKHGTGLLLDLGRRVTVTRVRVDLTQYQGASLQLRAGDGAVPANFRVIAAAGDTGGVVQLTPRHPASTRYLLIWFTLLPPDGSGHYQESVYHVAVTGQR